MKRISKKICNKYSADIFDIVLFGSAVKGKGFPEDVDVCIIFKKENLKVLKEFGKGVNVTRVLLSELYTQPLWQTLLREGFSLAHGKMLSEMLGFKSYGLYTYSTVGMKRKSRFSQVLSGYKAESMLKKTGAIAVKPGAVLVPIKKVEEFREFLDRWNAKYALKYVFVQ